MVCVEIWVDYFISNLLTYFQAVTIGPFQSFHRPERLVAKKRRHKKFVRSFEVRSLHRQFECNKQL